MSSRKLRGKSRLHPFKRTAGNVVLNTFVDPGAKIGTDPVFSTFHHLYPQDRDDVPHSIDKHAFVLNIWSHKHFMGWNKLFFIRICTNAKLKKYKTMELTIEEVLCLMLIKHKYIKDKVGTEPWNILFGKNKSLNDATDLLLRLFYIKEMKNNLSVKKEDLLNKRKHVLKLFTRKAA